MKDDPGEETTGTNQPSTLSRRSLLKRVPWWGIAASLALLGADVVSAVDRRAIVTAWGAGRGVDDVGAFELAVAAASAAGVDVYVPRGTYTFTGTVDLSSIGKPIRIVLGEGAIITQTENVPAFKAWGTLGEWTMLTADSTAQTRTCIVTSTRAFAVGDWIAIASSDVIPGSIDKIGMLRRITDMTATTLTVDKDLYRVFTTKNSAHIQPVTLLPPIEIVGRGQIRHADPATSTVPLVDLAAVESPFVDVELGPAGGIGLAVSWSVGPGGTGEKFYAHDLLDDGARGNFGYGIHNGGGNRELRFQGRCRRCRHGHTTGPGPNMPNSNRYGEPEDIVVDLDASDCMNKALDTHRAGWNIVFHPNVKGGAGGGVQLRADNCHVIGGTIADVGTVGVSVAASVRVPGVIKNTSITNVKGADATGVLLLGPADVSNLSVHTFTGSGIRVNAEGCRITDVVIDGGQPAPVKGLDIRGDRAVIDSVRISNVRTGVSIAPNATGARQRGVIFGHGVTESSTS